mmetsp:Transcript_67371/g.162985  ORF Transcript_67371/g.162985 Transcript_67371/m.162985 type:complete len:86 (-) Transcript_67371:162-419(-)
MAMIVAAIYWICGCHYTASSIQRSMNATLCNSNGLLLHDFVDCDPVRIIHFVKLVNTHDSSICKNHCTRFELSFTTFLVSGNCSS